jgi:CPA2 family monovalent cation:H+ antiporter-2
MGKVAGLLIVIIIMARWIIPAFLFRVVRLRSRELFFITIAGICVLIAWLTSEAGLSFTLGAFVAGLIIGESDYNIDALSHIIPFRDVFAAIFFLSIGMLLNTRMVLDNMYWVAFIVLVIIGVKILTGAFAAAVLGMPMRVCVFTGLALCQIGEFSFVLAQSGLETALIPVAVYQLFLAAAIITMALTPFAMNASPKAVDILYRLFPQRISRNERENETTGNESAALSDHIIIAGYGVTGKSVSRAAELTGISYVVIDLNPEIIKQEKAKRRSHVIFGDAVQEEVLEHAGITRARTLVVVVSEESAIPRIVHKARSLSPSVYIIARTRHIRHAKKLLDLGADEVVSEEFEAAREIFTRALRKYQFPETEIIKIVDRLQSWGYGRFIKNAETDPDVPGMDTLLHSLRIHTIFVEPGSTAAGKTLGKLELKNRFGIMDYGFKRDGITVMQPDETICLREGDALIIFASDEKNEEIRSLLFHG